MRALAGELEIGDKVDFVGFLGERELCSLYHASHIFVHPSQITADKNQEGIPNSMLEAMATGLPVLATYHGGIPEAVEHGQTGLLSAERDVDGLLHHLRQLAADPGSWAAMGQAASQAMKENFEQAAQVAKLEAIYREAIEQHGGQK